MNNNTQKIKRQQRIRAKLRGTKDTPRLSVYRSSSHIYAQLIDDTAGKTILGVSEKNLTNTKGNKTELAKALGLVLAEKSLTKKVKKVMFDKGPYKYHGRIKALAEGAREGGLKF